MQAVHELKQMADQVLGANFPASGDYEAYLTPFAEYECWEPYLALTEQGLRTGVISPSEAYLKILHTYVLCLDRLTDAKNISARFVQDMHLSFEQFHLKILPTINRALDSASVEWSLLNSVCNVFASNDDRVLCLERMALVCQKKLHDAGALHEIFERILTVAPSNRKALQYFKLVYLQNAAWDEVVKILLLMLETAQSQEETYRVAQELAGIYLYQLENPKDALSILQGYCLNSPLDTSTLEYEAHEQLADWPKCLSVLDRLLRKTEDPHQRAALHYFRAKVHRRLGEVKEAKEHVSLATQLWPSSLKPLEEHIQLLIAEKDWKGVKRLLARLLALVHKEDSKKTLFKLLARLRDDNENGGKSNKSID